jgi:hypothetical protein
MSKNKLNKGMNKLAVINVNMPEDLHHAFKVRCLIENKLMQDVVSALLRDYMKDYKSPKIDDGE